MIISEISLEQHADIFEQLTNRETHHASGEIIHSGHHPTLEHVLTFHNGSGTATLIELGKFLPGDTD